MARRARFSIPTCGFLARPTSTSTVNLGSRARLWMFWGIEIRIGEPRWGVVLAHFLPRARTGPGHRGGLSPKGPQPDYPLYICLKYEIQICRRGHEFLEKRHAHILSIGARKTHPIRLGQRPTPEERAPHAQNFRFPRVRRAKHGKPAKPPQSESDLRCSSQLPLPINHGTVPRPA